jgi:hypothetical protein
MGSGSTDKSRTNKTHTLHYTYIHTHFTTHTYIHTSLLTHTPSQTSTVVLQKWPQEHPELDGVCFVSVRDGASEHQHVLVDGFGEVLWCVCVCMCVCVYVGWWVETVGVRVCVYSVCVCMCVRK